MKPRICKKRGRWTLYLYCCPPRNSQFGVNHPMSYSAYEMQTHQEALAILGLHHKLVGHVRG